MGQLTGTALGHSKAINKLINASPYNESQFIVRPETEWLSLDAARERARQIWPNETILGTKAAEYHGFVTIQFSKPSGTVIVAIKTGHFYKKTRWYRHTYSPSGELRDRKVYWSYLFHYFHEAGWVNNRFGTLCAIKPRATASSNTRFMAELWVFSVEAFGSRPILSRRHS